MYMYERLVEQKLPSWNTLQHAAASFTGYTVIFYRETSLIVCYICPKTTKSFTAC